MNKEAEEEGAEPVQGFARCTGRREPSCRGVKVPLEIQLEPGFEAFKCWVQVFAFYSLGTSCHQRFKFQDLMSDITKVTSDAD